MPVDTAARRVPSNSRCLVRLACLGALSLAASPAAAKGILTLGGLAVAPVTSAITASIVSAQQAAAVAARSRNDLSRVTQALRALQTMQSAAQRLSFSTPAPNVPNGLVAGGLVPAVTGLVPAAQDATGIATWQGATLPSQKIAAGRVDVTIRQTVNNAVLTWKSFNVGAKTALNFDQQGNANWVVLNRVTDPSASPSEILGSITADGTVLLINANGIIFGAGSQVNANSLIASSLDIGNNEDPSATLQSRTLRFIQQGILGAYTPTSGPNGILAFSSNVVPVYGANLAPEGAVTVQAGARITARGTASTAGEILLLGPRVVNAGVLQAPDGQVALESGRYIFIAPNTGTASSANRNVRGLLFYNYGLPGGDNDYYSWNKSTGLIEADRGNITLGSATVDENNYPVLVNPTGAIINDGVLLATTSVSRNGSIILSNGAVRLSPGSVLAIEPDADGETIPTDPATLAAFKTSDVEIGQSNYGGGGNIEIDSNALVEAPGGNITIGSTNSSAQSIFINGGAVIDASGVENVLIPASRNEVTITPVKGNELADDPNYRGGFLNGATVHLDPRLSGVRADGVAWIGSPLIDAAAYYQLVGVSAAELMTKGGNVSLNGSADTVIKAGAVVDIAGGWVTYQPGTVGTTTLVDGSGHLVPIAQADPFNDTFVGIYNGFAVDHARWGVTQTYGDPLRSQTQFEPGYTEGRDAGSLAVVGSGVVLDGTVDAEAFAGAPQVLAGQQGTATSSVAGDQRSVQAANSQLPAGGFLSVLGNIGIDGLGNVINADDISIVPSAAYRPLPAAAALPPVPYVAADGSLTPSMAQPITTPGGQPAPAPAPPPLAASLQNRLLHVTLSDRLLSGSGFSDVALTSQGSMQLARGAAVNLGNGGVFNVLAGRAITIDGGVIAPSGKIALQTVFGGSPDPKFVPALGDYDITVNGALSVAGRWVNDYRQPDGAIEGGAWLNGGTISIYAAPRILSLPTNVGTFNDAYGDTAYQSPASTATVQDISGSIFINSGARLNLDGGGRIDQQGNMNLTAKGGSLSLKSDTTYFQLYANPYGQDLSGFRVANPQPNFQFAIKDNPGSINARVLIDPAAISAHGFGGGGAFTLSTPQFGFGTGKVATGTLLPMDFFSSAGFASYNVTSYKTVFSANPFTNGQGGYDAVLATQTLTIGAGQTLSLRQSFLPNLPSAAQRSALFNLPDGGNVLAAVQPGLPSDAWDAKPVSLTLGGLIELDVDKGGSITGAAGAALTVSKLLNQGTIRLPGGVLTQQENLPAGYAAAPTDSNSTPHINGGVRQLSDLLTVAPDGSIDPNALAKIQELTSTGYVTPTNGQVVADAFDLLQVSIYFLGRLDADQGIVLAPGSVTDLSGTVITDPHALAANGTVLGQGLIVPGGTIVAATAANTPAVFTSPTASGFAGSQYAVDDPTGQINPDLLEASPGASLNVSGAAGVLDQFAGGTSLARHGIGAAYALTPVWSDAGSIIAGNGGIFGGARIAAHGGATLANGGTLEILDPVFSEHDPLTPQMGDVSADMIASAGIATLIATGGVGSSGDATIKLARGLFVQDRSELSYSLNANTSNSTIPVSSGQLNPIIDLPRVSATGRLEIDAPVVSFNSQFDVLGSLIPGPLGTGSVIFNARDIDFTGSANFGPSVANVVLRASGDIRFTGVPSWQSVLTPTLTPPSLTLNGALAVDGNLSLIAGQVYPTTGSSYVIRSAAAQGVITFGRDGAVPVAPYSAGGNLSVQAANIVQGGVLRVPFGSLSLGSNTGDSFTNPGSGVTTTLTPATRSIVFAPGSVTSVSAGGLDIPYGTTTDETEWYFNPTSSLPITAPPAKILNIGAASITIDRGARLDLTGGGDTYAYEFVPGTGGTHDVLSQLNADPYTGDHGLAYPDGRQVYAIVPGLSAQPQAAYDPIYAAGYAPLANAAGAGEDVYLAGGNGLAGGWYTLLPAQYALLPGGMRVVQQTGATAIAPGASTVLPDGGLLVSGYFGNAFAGSRQSQPVQFSIDSQARIRAYSQIALSSGDALAIRAAATAGTLTPPLGVDAGRLVLNPLTTLIVNAAVSTLPGAGGRGAEVDIGGASIDILASLNNAAADGAIHVAAASLDNLNAESLLIGATRTDNIAIAKGAGAAENTGTTTLDVTARNILVANNAATPLRAPEIILVVDDQTVNPAASTLTLANGATIIASGVVSDPRSGAYIIVGETITVPNPINSSQPSLLPAPDSGTGALFRVSNGAQRVVLRETNAQTPVVPAGSLAIGNITAQGASITLDTSNNLDVANDAVLKAQSLALDAPVIMFGAASRTVPGAVLIDPRLQALLSRASSLILNAQATIGFDDGDYVFGKTTLNAQALVALQGGDVTIATGDLAFGDNGAAGTPVVGTGSLNIHAHTLTFDSGAVATSGFGAVALSSAAGTFIGGAGAALNTGAASLTLTTAYLGDQVVTGLPSEMAGDLTLTTTGAVAITNGGGVPLGAAGFAGLSGSAVTIMGNGIAVTGTTIRATSGLLKLISTSGIALGDGATLEVPGYARGFGDPVDPVVQAAPGGTLSLAASGSSGIALGNATLSASGGAGNAGSLDLAAPAGAVDFGVAVLNGGGAGVFSLDTAGAVDLVALNAKLDAAGFTGGFNIRAGTGNITLAAGQTISARAVSLTADGGLVNIAGTIDTAGIDGGPISLYGNQGVTLLGTARLEATAAGYPLDDSRQAHGGDVTLGTDFINGSTVTNADGSISGASGTIKIAAGAAIDVRALRPGDRLVQLMRNGILFYQFAQGDQGGTVTLRAPVTSGGGGTTVDVSVADARSVIGARAIDLEGFKRWNLPAVAASGLFSGVAYDSATNTATLDVTAGLDTANPDGSVTVVPGLNFLGDAGGHQGPGTVVDFIRNYNVSADDGNLGGLVGKAGFQARPGVEFDNAGNITLATNWNLGAGVVDLTAAESAGLVARDPTTGELYVIPGDEAALLAAFTKLTYRVGGTAAGAAPVVSFRAGGDLHLQGSLTDGFFAFRDQYDPTYLSFIYGPAPGYLTYSLAAQQFFNDTYETYSQYLLDHGSGGGDYFAGSLDTSSVVQSSSPRAINIPYNALDNAPAALGTDPVANADIFPLLPGGSVVASSSFGLAGGAALNSADPAAVNLASTGNLLVDGPKQQNLTFNDAPQAILGIQVSVQGPEFQSLSFNAGSPGFDAYLEQNLQGVSGDVEVSLSDSSDLYQPLINAFVAAHPGTSINENIGNGDQLDMSLATAASFIQQVLPQLNSGGGGGGVVSTTTISVIPQPVIRTGTGDIALSAAGNVDLSGGPTIDYLGADGTIVTDPTTENSTATVGGAAVYTAGHPVGFARETLADPVTGTPVVIDPTSFIPTTNLFSTPPAASLNIPELVYANPVFLQGGGDVAINAGQDVLGRRDLTFQVAGNYYQLTGQKIPFIGSVTEPWRLQTVTGTQITSQIVPEAFRGAVGALGGGGVTVNAGRDISDLSVDTDHSIITATATPAQGVPTLAALSYGSGDLSLTAGRDILGGSMEIANGLAVATAGRDIGPAAGSIIGEDTVYTYLPDGSYVISYVPRLLPDQVELSIDDATASLSAQGSLNIQGVTALGAANTGTSLPENIVAGFASIDTLDPEGLYSAHSGLDLLANGAISTTNFGYGSDFGGLTTGSTTGVYPASLNATSITGDLNFQVAAQTSFSTGNGSVSAAVLLIPSPDGQLNLYAGGDILPTTIAMLDADPGLLPGLFSADVSVVTNATIFAFPAVEPDTADLTKQEYHNKTPTHENDPQPVRVYADGSIGDSTEGVTLSVAKQARIYAGVDIVNMAFFGQNLHGSDITRIVAGRDITASTQLIAPQTGLNLYGNPAFGQPLPTLLGNTFVLGGPGQLFLQAGRDMGPFLNSANVAVLESAYVGGGQVNTTVNESFAGGVLTIGDDWNPYLPKTGADVNVLFGVAHGADFNALRDAYVAPGAADAASGYGAALLQWMRRNAAAALLAAYGTSNVTVAQAYAAFTNMPELDQEAFLISDVYFNELRQTAVVGGPSYLKYGRGYQAVNTLFPAALGYTANNLGGGANGAATIVQTGNLDLRLATIETTRGGNINILGPGGSVLAGSVVSTSVQAARRAYTGYGIYSGYVLPIGTTINAEPILSIPTGAEGVLTLRGGNINSFTDGNFLVNQSRVFTEEGGNLTLWSSNADLNAGKGAKTTASFPPVVVHIDNDGFIQVDAQGGVTGAGIATLQSVPGAPPGDVYLIAPRGTVDAGDAGVRVSGNLSVAAFHVANADNFQVQGTAVGIPHSAAPNLAAQTAANNTAGAAAQAAESAAKHGPAQPSPSIWLVEVLGYGGAAPGVTTAPPPRKPKKPVVQASYDPNSLLQLVGNGVLTDTQKQALTDDEKRNLDAN